MCGIDKVLTIHAHGGVNLVSRKSKRLESRVDSVYSCQLHLVLQREMDVEICRAAWKV